MKEFKAGQVWRTRCGNTTKVLKVSEGPGRTYPVDCTNGVCYTMGGMAINNGDENQVDLMELVSYHPSEKQAEPKKHPHYHKPVNGRETIDVYDVLDMFEVDTHPIGHAIKKLLVAGKRGGGKDRARDFQEAIDSIQRAIEIEAIDAGK